MESETQTGMMSCEMTLDVICPYCYLGHHFIQRYAPEWNLRLDYRGFELHPETPVGGLDLRAMGDRVSRLTQRVLGLAEEFGLAWDREFRPPAVLPNTRLAHRWVALMETRGVDRLKSYPALMEAYFGEGRDIGQPDVLKEIALDLGAPGEEIGRELEAGGGLEAFWEMRERALDNMATVVPYYRIEGFPIPGAQNKETFQRVIEKIRAKRARKGSGDGEKA